MRIAPLVLFDSYIPVMIDSLLSNFNYINLSCSVVYYYTARMLFLQKPLKDIYQTIITISKEEVILQAINDAYSNKERDISGKDSGWIVHALWVSLKVLFQQLDYPTAIKYIIGKKGDTDTNACISGYLLGIRDGETKLKSDPISKSNLEVLFSVIDEKGYKKTEYIRQPEYTLFNFEQRMEKLAKWVS